MSTQAPAFAINTRYHILHQSAQASRHNDVALKGKEVNRTEIIPKLTKQRSKLPHTYARGRGD